MRSSQTIEDPTMQTQENRSEKTCDFDHLGIILKLNQDPDDIYFLEVPFDAKSSSEFTKVRLNRWRQLSNFIGN